MKMPGILPPSFQSHSSLKWTRYVISHSVVGNPSGLAWNVVPLIEPTCPALYLMHSAPSWTLKSPLPLLRPEMHHGDSRGLSGREGGGRFRALESDDGGGGIVAAAVVAGLGFVDLGWGGGDVDFDTLCLALGGVGLGSMEGGGDGGAGVDLGVLGFVVVRDVGMAARGLVGFSGGGGGGGGDVVGFGFLGMLLCVR